jgi:hypothetical protein
MIVLKISEGAEFEAVVKCWRSSSLKIHGNELWNKLRFKFMFSAWFNRENLILTHLETISEILKFF